MAKRQEFIEIIHSNGAVTKMPLKKKQEIQFFPKSLPESLPGIMLAFVLFIVEIMWM